MQPIKNMVLVKPFPADGITEGGLIVPESAQKTSNKVKIVAVGNGTAQRPMQFAPGQTGYRVQDWGTDVVIDGELHFLMDMDAIIAHE